jgi:CheY-like chemotaxis protein
MKRVLIVDDSLELGRWLQTALTQLDAQIQATVYPSGEEALLESSRRPIDVLVTDIRLAGMSGLELVRKIRKRYPGIRVIVITGMQDMSVEKQAKELGIDAFFRKPMNIPSFLDAVNACLKVDTGQEAPPEPQPAASPPQPTVVRTEISTNLPPSWTPLSTGTSSPSGTLSPSWAPGTAQPSTAISSLTILLTGLRKDLGALAALLLDENGRVLARSGSFPDSSFEGRWPQVLTETVRSTLKVSKLLGSPTPRNMIALQGMAFDLVLAPVGNCALVLALRTGRPTLRLGLAFEEILNIQKNLLALITDQEPVEIAPAIRPEVKPVPPPVKPVEEPAPPTRRRTGPLTAKTAPLKVEPPTAHPVDEPPSADFAALFQEKAGLNTQDVDSFWETAAGSGSTPAPGSDAITYEQARKMGLAPGLDDEK